MSTEIMEINQSHREFSSKEIALIKSTCAPKNASQDEIESFLYLCNQYQLDPIKRELVFWKDKDGKCTYMSTRDGYLKHAALHPDYEGLVSSPVYEGDEFSIDPVSQTVHHKLLYKSDKLIGAYAIAYRRGVKPVICFAPFSEYNKGFGSWKSNPSAMIQKVPESMALKRQFCISGLVTQEEISNPDEGAERAKNITPDDGDGHPPYWRHLSEWCQQQFRWIQEYILPRYEEINQKLGEFSIDNIAHFLNAIGKFAVSDERKTKGKLTNNQFVEAFIEYRIAKHSSVKTSTGEVSPPDDDVPFDDVPDMQQEINSAIEACLPTFSKAFKSAKISISDNQIRMYAANAAIDGQITLDMLNGNESGCAQRMIEIYRSYQRQNVADVNAHITPG